MHDNFVVACSPLWAIKSNDLRRVFAPGKGAKKDWRVYQQVAGVFASSSSSSLLWGGCRRIPVILWRLRCARCDP